MLQVSELFVYPIKSLGGISLSSSAVTDRGLEYDRRWMLVDADHNFMTQRSVAAMALLQAELRHDGILVYHKQTKEQILVPFQPSGESIMVTVWSSRCKGLVVSAEVSEWFSTILSMPCQLVYMPDATRRRVDGRYAKQKEITSFSDAYPFLLIGQSSLDDLNEHLTEVMPINRFRPNIVFTGGVPFEEDCWARFRIQAIEFFGVKLCARCVVTTIHQQTAVKGKEPLKTLATYRQLNHKIYFGQNLLHSGKGIISVGDEIEVLERKAPRIKSSRLNFPV